MTVFLLILAGICFLYFVILLLGAGVSSAFVWFWPAASFVFAFTAWLREHFRMPVYLRVLLYSTALAAILLFFLVESVIIRHCFDRGSQNLDYLIVLGAQVRGEVVSRSLKMRLDEAIDYLQDNPDTVVIVSGGQGPGEDITEAEAMAVYLEEHGISAVRIRKEEHAVNTEENIRFSMEQMEGENPSVGIVTNNFHVFRSVQIGKKLGLVHVEGIAAPSEGFLQVNYLVREFFAVIKYFISGTL